jgi:hypothetical protein
VNESLCCTCVRQAEDHPAARRRAMRRARVVPRSFSRRVESLQVDTRACRGRAHPSAQGRGLAVGTPPPLARGVAWHRHGSVSTPHAAFFDFGSRPSCRAALLRQGLTHAVSAGPSAPQRRPELRPAPRHHAHGGRPCRAAGCSPCVGAEVCCARLLALAAA